MVTICCHDRRVIFDRIEHWRCLVAAMRALEAQAQTWCYVAMPDHFHWMMQLVEPAELSKCVQKLKSLATKKLRSSSRVSGAIWQRGFHDRALRAEEDMKDVARYMVANPVRAGLVRSPGEYPFWDAAWL